jgi:hypothetical protein
MLWSTAATTTIVQIQGQTRHITPVSDSVVKQVTQKVTISKKDNVQVYGTNCNHLVLMG